MSNPLLIASMYCFSPSNISAANKDAPSTGVYLGCLLYTSNTKSITYISERDDTYQKAIAKVYDVTDEKFWAYLEKLKNYKQSNLLELKKNSIKSYANENFTFSFH